MDITHRVPYSISFNYYSVECVLSDMLVLFNLIGDHKMNWKEETKRKIAVMQAEVDGATIELSHLNELGLSDGEWFESESRVIWNGGSYDYRVKYDDFSEYDNLTIIELPPKP
jgi:hypothetical protein